MITCFYGMLFLKDPRTHYTRVDTLKLNSNFQMIIQIILHRWLLLVKCGILTFTPMGRSAYRYCIRQAQTHWMLKRLQRRDGDRSLALRQSWCPSFPCWTIPTSSLQQTLMQVYNSEMIARRTPREFVNWLPNPLRTCEQNYLPGIGLLWWRESASKNVW